MRQKLVKLVVSRIKYIFLLSVFKTDGRGSKMADL